MRAVVVIGHWRPFVAADLSFYTFPEFSRFDVRVIMNSPAKAIQGLPSGTKGKKQALTRAEKKFPNGNAYALKI